MYTKNIYIIGRIKRYLAIKKYLSAFCFAVIGIGFLIFLFYVLKTKDQAMRFVSDNKLQNIEKVMTNPRIKFEYSDNEFYDIKADKAVYKSEQDILLYNVLAEGDLGNIKSGKLLVKNNGNDLYFSDDPVLIIKQTADKK